MEGGGEYRGEARPQRAIAPESRCNLSRRHCLETNTNSCQVDPLVWLWVEGIIDNC